jgi:hypothetical protein
MKEPYNYQKIPEFSLSVLPSPNNDGGNSDKFKVIMRCEMQPFLVDGKEQMEISFVVVGHWEMAEIANAFRNLPIQL